MGRKANRQNTHASLRVDSSMRLCRQRNTNQRNSNYSKWKTLRYHRFAQGWWAFSPCFGKYTSLWLEGNFTNFAYICCVIFPAYRSPLRLKFTTVTSVEMWVHVLVMFRLSWKKIMSWSDRRLNLTRNAWDWILSRPPLLTSAGVDGVCIAFWVCFVLVFLIFSQ